MDEEPIKTDELHDNSDYIAAIQELKEKSVSKEQYVKLKEENAQLLRSLINGDALEGVDTPMAPDINELRTQLFSGEVQMSNLEYVTKALELRDALIADGRPDPFLPYGEKIAPTDDDISAAQRVAKVLQECVEYADGDSSIFTNELQRRMIDTGPKGLGKK
ncbi:MAG: hypothetical protein NC127_08900 [Muribaculum sp.]|nr:hypothetical protein [Muribaculum sp.]